MSHNITRRVSGNLEDFHQLTGVGEWPILKMSNIILRYFETVVRYCWTIYDVHKCAYCRLVCLWIYIYIHTITPALGVGWWFFFPKNDGFNWGVLSHLGSCSCQDWRFRPRFLKKRMELDWILEDPKKTKNLMRSLYSPRTGFTGCWRGDLLLPSGYWTACEVENCPFTSMIYDDSPIQNCDCP